VDVDKSRRRVSLTAIAPGSERPHRPPREKREQRGPRPPRQQGGRSQGAPSAGAPSAGEAAPAQGQRPAGGQGRPPQGQRPTRQYGGGGRREQRGRPQQQQHSRTVERRPTKPKPVKPITKAMEEGKEPLRSFSDLMQLFDKKKQKPASDGLPPPADGAA
jgi:protein Tex